MEWVVITTVLVLAQYTLFGIQVGQMRAKHGVKAPAMTGPPEFERMLRVHYNSMELLVMLLPLMWLYAHLVNPIWAAALGLVFVVGRFIYRSAYLKDPSTRSLGFNLSFVPIAVMGMWSLVEAVRDLL